MVFPVLKVEVLFFPDACCFCSASLFFALFAAFLAFAHAADDSPVAPAQFFSSDRSAISAWADALNCAHADPAPPLLLHC